MSKIPQGEWSAIAARYQSGESISKIARGYSCTPPAIHYILKRHRASAAQTQQLPERMQIAAVGAAASAEPNPSPGQCERAGAAPVLVRTRAAPARVMDAPRGVDAPLVADLPRAAPTPGLDSELHDRAEAAIETFRSSFDAALIEGSPGVRARLREAASNLMRVAARTTIVLDRLNASAERLARAPNYPRSAHMR